MHTPQLIEGHDVQWTGEIPKVDPGDTYVLSWEIFVPYLTGEQYLSGTFKNTVNFVLVLSFSKPNYLY